MTHTKNMKKYAIYLKDELEAASIYNILAKYYPESEKATIFSQLAKSEMKHAEHWAQYLDINSKSLTQNKKTPKTIYIEVICKLFGPDKILPWIAKMESKEISAYGKDPDAQFLVEEELNHARTISDIALSTLPKSHSDNELIPLMQSSGNIRAAILGFNDGLISNFCLIMGFAGGTVIAGNPEYILLAGFAGLIAGSLSMGAGEYVSMKAQVDLYRYQIQKEQEEILLWPEEEEEELKLIYMAKGLSEDIAIKTAQKIMSNPKSAIDTMAREELGLNPHDLGSPIKASLTSILAFAFGAIVPIIPFIFTLGNTAIFISAILSTFVIMIIGGITAINTGVDFFKGASRMLLFGGFAAVITYISGTLIGIGLS